MQWALIGIALAAALAYLAVAGWRFVRRMRQGQGPACGGCGDACGAHSLRKTAHPAQLTLNGRSVDD